MPVHVVQHPRVQDASLILPEARTGPEEFGRIATRISVLLAVEAMRDLPTADRMAHAPLGPARGRGAGARNARIACSVAAPDGIAVVEQRYPDVHVYTPLVDEGLNAHTFIVSGLGDFGDRLYGTL